MKKELLPYYESELQFIREMAKEFAHDHPRIAGRLLLEGDRCSDPHVERLIQSFALIAGRIRHKIDDEFPEITEALLGVLYPHYVRPIPSMAIAQFAMDTSQGKLSGSHVIPRHTYLHSRTVSGMGISCRFRTCYPVTVWPLRITSVQVLPAAALGATTQTSAPVAAIRIGFKCEAGLTPAKMNLTNLRFALNGEGDLPYTLYELILNSVREVWLTAPTGEDTVLGPIRFPSGAIQAVGFGRDEGMLPYPAQSFLGYRLLSEYFALPEKFLFFDLNGFARVITEAIGEVFEITFVIGDFERKERLRKLERAVRADTFQLGCTPIVNLFDRPAKPIRVTHAQTEYAVVPDSYSPLAAEVYSVDKVTSIASYLDQPREYQPFYGLRHVYDSETPNAFWFASRRGSNRKDDRGSEVYISLVDLGFRPAQAGTESLSIHATWTNRDLPALLPLTQDFGDLSIETTTAVRVRCLTKLTESVRPPLLSGLQWRLISHLALNYLSVAENAAPLREILKLYNFTDHPGTADMITGITSVKSQPHLTRMLTPAGVAFSLGMRIQIEFDEDRYVNSGVFLMACILERFLGLYTSVNSFTQVTATTRQRKERLRAWAPRAGEQILV